jgi:hypothetical protein
MRPAGRRLSAALSPEVNTADRAASYRTRRRRFVCRWYPAINVEVNAVRQINESAVTRVHASLYEHNTRGTARICGTGFEETTNRCLDSYNDAECVLQLKLTFAGVSGVGGHVRWGQWLAGKILGCPPENGSNESVSEKYSPRRSSRRRDQQTTWKERSENDGKAKDGRSPLEPIRRRHP